VDGGGGIPPQTHARVGGGQRDARPPKTAPAGAQRGDWVSVGPDVRVRGCGCNRACARTARGARDQGHGCARGQGCGCNQACARTARVARSQLVSVHIASSAVNIRFQYVGIVYGQTGINGRGWCEQPSTQSAATPTCVATEAARIGALACSSPTDRTYAGAPRVLYFAWR